MWRRRPIQPIRRPPLRRPARRAHPKLVEAHKLFQNGDYLEAAKLFEELADKAEKNKIPQAPRLYLQAGAAWIKAEEKDKGIEIIKKGLGKFIERKKWAELKRSASAVVHRLRENGLNEQAVEIETWLEKQVPQEVKEAPVWVKATSVRGSRVSAQLPTNCPKCGGPVNPKEVDWIDTSTAACVYCGSLLRAD
ncbi:MAG TPA: hypothetical protein G4N92_09785 [Anaerolineae bacterium]|nr:hypothetical protein [Anaerolineae bacterium]